MAVILNLQKTLGEILAAIHTSHAIFIFAKNNYQYAHVLADIFEIDQLKPGISIAVYIGII